MSLIYKMNIRFLTSAIVLVWACMVTHGQEMEVLNFQPFDGYQLERSDTMLGFADGKVKVKHTTAKNDGILRFSIAMHIEKWDPDFEWTEVDDEGMTIIHHGDWRILHSHSGDSALLGLFVGPLCWASLLGLFVGPQR